MDSLSIFCYILVHIFLVSYAFFVCPSCTSYHTQLAVFNSLFFCLAILALVKLVDLYVIQLHKVNCLVGSITVVVGCPHVLQFFALGVLLMCRGLQIKATFYDFSSLFAHLLTMFSFVVFPP